MVEVAKRLSFGDQSLHWPEFVQVHEVLKAVSQPSIENFNRALEHLEAANHDRFVKIQEVAKEHAAGGGESDLRRLKRQFSSLKNTFMLYDVKDSFIDGLRDNCPDGTEEGKLEEYDQEVQKHAAGVKKNKEVNAEVREQLRQLVADLVARYEDFRRQREEVGLQLAQLNQAKLSQNDAALPAPPEPNSGPSHEECRAMLAVEGSRARDLESRSAAAEAEAAELRQAIQGEEDELQMLAAQIEQLEAAESSNKQEADANLRFLDAIEWCNQMSGLMTALGGVSLLQVAADAVHLMLTTPLSSSADDARVVLHTLTLCLERGTSTLASAELNPPSVDILDLVDAAEGGRCTLGFVVREVQARLADLHSSGTG